MKRIHIIFSGKVQGIGFRYRTLNLAEKMAINGWVKNLSDDEVEMMAEAEEKNLQDFIAEIKKYFQNYIQDVQLEWQKPTGEFQNFQVRF